MSIESSVISAVGSEVAGAAVSSVAESAVSSVAGSVLGGVVSAANPFTSVFTIMKIAGVAVVVAGLVYGAIRFNSFLETAADDHAVRASLIKDLAKSEAVVAANLVTARTDAATVQKQIADANALLAAAKERADNLEIELDTMDVTPSVGCTPSPAARAVINGLMH